MEKERLQQLQKELSALAKELGADVVGFCDLQNQTAKLAPHLNHAVSVIVKLSSAVLATIEDGPSFVYFQHYRTANTLLDQIAFRLAREMEKMGYLAMPVAASQSLGKENPYRGVVPHKTVAVLSGLGFVGKSGLFLSKDYGSKVRLATILTNAPLQSELPVIENGCGDCELCKKPAPPAQFTARNPPQTAKEILMRKNVRNI